MTQWKKTGINRILKMESCAGSSSMIEVVHNPKNDVFGIFVTDELGYNDLIALRRDQVENLLKTVSDYMEGKE